MKKKLPQGWKEEYLVNVVDVINDRVKEYEGERNYLSTGDLNFNVIENLELVTFDTKPSRANQNVKVNDVIFAKMKDTKKTLIINEDIKDIIVSTGFFVLRAKEIIDSRYLYFYLNSSKFLREKDNLCTGATQSALNLQGLKKIKILVPTIEEQVKIVNILKISEQTLVKRKEAINLLDELVKSKFIEMFGELKNNKNNFDIVALESLTTKITDGVHSKPDYTAEGVEFISVKDINKGKLDFSNCKYISQEAHESYIKRCKPEIGDVLYTKVGATYGIPAVVDIEKEFSLYVSVALLKLKKDIVNPVYIKEALRSVDLKRQADRQVKGIGVPDLHLVEIKKFKIFNPPLELQNQFADFVKEVDKLKFEMEKSLKELEDNFNSLMQKAFKGELFD